jgi:hypothetical protein
MGGCAISDPEITTSHDYPLVAKRDLLGGGSHVKRHHVLEEHDIIGRGNSLGGQVHQQSRGDSNPTGHKRGEDNAEQTAHRQRGVA